MASSLRTFPKQKGALSQNFTATLIDVSSRFIEEGGDWDRHNRLKAYHGL
jgi:hypothetical protein